MNLFQALRRSKSDGGDPNQKSQDGRPERPGLLSRLRRNHTDTATSRGRRSTESSSKGATSPELKRSSRSESSISGLEHGTPDTFYYNSSKDQVLLNDVKRVFSGAPHFILERGRDGKLYPQVIFPWDQDQGIQDLWDHQPLRHISFILCTLHAHLPVPDDWSGGRPRTNPSRSDKVGGKRATVDTGVFEVPNMLGRSTKELGCVGYRNYMELPISDSRAGKRHHRYSQFLQNAGDSASRDTAQKVGKDSEERRPKVDHHRWSTKESASTPWERIGVRNPEVKVISQRLARLQELRDIIVIEGRFLNLLEIDSSRSLYKELFSKFLYPPAKLVDYKYPYCIKAQIEVLTDVLSVENAWIDFSRVEWRLRLGQVLFDNPAYGNEDFVKSLPRILEGGPGVERKWLLIQMVLAAELLIRLDAALQSVIRPTKGLSVTSKDIHKFNTMRTPKVSWDLVFIRRIFDNLSIHFSMPQKSGEMAEGPDPDSPVTHVFELGFSDDKLMMDLLRDATSWNCVFLPRHPTQQIDGLLVFARCIQWPNIDEIEGNIKAKLEPSQTQSVTVSRMYGPPVHTSALDRKQSGKESSHQNVEVEGQLKEHDQPFRGFVRLHTCEDPRNPTALDIGGFLSRSWLTGMVLPGEPIEHLLISTLLENDHRSMEKVGPLANLFGGFILDNRSWWSKFCIVGRVLACLDGTSECMGWISSHIIPRNGNGEELDNGWLDVEAKKATTKVFPSKKRTRILDGVRVALESSPLGMDDEDISADSFSLPVDGVASEPHRKNINFQHLILSSSEGTENKKPGLCSRKRGEKPCFCHAALVFTLKPSMPKFASFSRPETISLPLIYNVQYVAAHPCRPPRGLASNKKGFLSSLAPNISKEDYIGEGTTSNVSSTLPSPRSSAPSSTSSNQPQLPAHPLHASYPYLHIPLSSLPSLLSSTSLSSPSVPASTSQPSISRRGSRGPLTATTKVESVYILDARRSREAELFARAWCATTGNDAIVGRTGRTCLSCCIREARAVGVKVVIRIGA